MLKKQTRSYAENRIIELFFQQFKSINSLLLGYSKFYEDSLSSFASAVRAKTYEKNNIIFKTGEKSDRFFVILKGSVSIISIRDRQISLSEQEYKTYLRNLKKYDETFILVKVLWENSHIYPVEEADLVKNNTNEVSLYAKRHGSIVNVRVLKNDLAKFKSRSDLLMHKLSDSGITPFSYASRVKPRQFDSSPKQRVTVYEYFVVNTLHQGDTFGNLSLEKNHTRRSATVMSEEKSVLAYVSIDEMQSILRNTRGISDICKILSFYFMWNVSKSAFIQSFYPYFVIKHFGQEERLFKQGETRMKVFFIKKGFFKATCRMNLREINKLLRNFGIKDEKMYKKKLDFKDYFSLLEKEEEIQIFESDKRDVLGLDDAILGKKYVYTVRCYGEENEVYSVDHVYFNKLVEAEPEIKESIDLYMNKRKKDLIRIFVRKKHEIIQKKLLNRDLKIEDRLVIPIDYKQPKLDEELLNSMKTFSKWPQLRKSPFQLFTQRQAKVDETKREIVLSQSERKPKRGRFSAAKKFYGKKHRRTASKEDKLEHSRDANNIFYRTITVISK